MTSPTPIKCWVNESNSGMYTNDTKITSLEGCFLKHIDMKENKKCHNCVLYSSIDSKDPPTLPAGEDINWTGCSYTNENGSVCKE